MGAHPNVHVPKESWPGWTWYAIEFGIVLAVSFVIGWKVSDQILHNIAMSLGLGDALESWVGISVHSADFKALEDTIELQITTMSNWIFYAIVGGIFLAWYIGIRGFILKKKILRNSY